MWKPIFLENKKKIFKIAFVEILPSIQNINVRK